MSKGERKSSNTCKYFLPIAVILGFCCGFLAFKSVEGGVFGVLYAVVMLLAGEIICLFLPIIGLALFQWVVKYSIAGFLFANTGFTWHPLFLIVEFWVLFSNIVSTVLGIVMYVEIAEVLLD